MKKYFSVLKIFLLEKCLPCVPGSLLSVMMTIRLFLRKKVKISQIPQYDNVKLFDINEIKDATLNPLFIMGCGMSINDLSAVEKKFIESSTSVGINLFVISDIIPTYLTWEDPKKLGLHDLYLHVLANKGSKFSERAPKLLLHDGFLQSGYNLEKLAGFFNEVRIYTTARMVSFDKKKLRESYKYLFNPWVMKLMGPGMIYGLQSTLDRLTHMAIAADFKEIVFIGIDLDDPRYFWEDLHIDKYINGELRKLIKVDLNKPHLTERKSGQIPVSEVIKLASSYAESKGMKFYTSSTKSKLSSFLPIYKFPKN